jgi:hypothetical protein
MSRFSAFEDEQLIDLIHGHPMIWNITVKEYKNVPKKEVIWNQIGKMLKKSGKLILFSIIGNNVLL